MTRDDAGLLAGGAFVGLGVGAASIAAESLMAMAVAGSLALLLAWRPAVLIGLIAIIDENFRGTPYFDGSPPVLTAGWPLYDGRIAGFSPSFALLVIAAAGMMVRLVLSRRTTRSNGKTSGDAVAATLIGLSALAVTMSLLQEEAGLSPRGAIQLAVNAAVASLPWLTTLLAYAVCVQELKAPDFLSKLAKIGASVLVTKAIIGAGVLAVHGGATVDAQSHVIFYDAALPALAASCLLGYLLAPASRRARLWCVLASGSIVLFSFRRAIWLALVAGFLLLPVARKRTYLVARVLAVVAASAIVVAVLPAGVRSTAFGRVGSAISVVESGRGEASAQAHADDVKVGFEAARANPITGIGVRAPQLKKLAAIDATALYIHNDFLQTWLRFGILGLAGLLLLLAVAAHRAWRVLSSSDSLGVLEASAAAFCLTIALPLMTAPFITTTRRWPIILGLAMAVLRAALVRAEDAPAQAVTSDSTRTLVQVGAMS